jgi:general secretion pathway protein G
MSGHANRPTPSRPRAAGPTGFTLVEILIVVIILGILAAMVIPQFTRATTEAREATARETRRGLHSTIELYRIQHAEQLPDLIGTNWAALTGKTDMTGAPSAAIDAMGPYIQSPPVNPMNRSTTVAAAPAVNVGWVYNQATGDLDATDADWVILPR